MTPILSKVTLGKIGNTSEKSRRTDNKLKANANESHYGGSNFSKMTNPFGEPQQKSVGNFITQQT